MRRPGTPTTRPDIGDYPLIGGGPRIRTDKPGTASSRHCRVGAVAHLIQGQQVLERRGVGQVSLIVHLPSYCRTSALDSKVGRPRDLIRDQRVRRASPRFTRERSKISV